MPVDPSTLPVNLDVLIDYDRPCGACGYNLIGLRLSDRCPECGAAIKRPLNMQLAACDFAHWSPEGLRVLAWSFRGLAALAVTLPLCAFWWSVTAGRLFPFLAAGVTGLLAAALPALVWAISRVPPRLEDLATSGSVTVERPRWWANVRLLARAGACAPLAACVPAVLLTFGPGSALAPALEWGVLITGVAASLATTPLLLLVALFAGEAHDERLDDTARWCLWGLPIALVIQTLALGGAPLGSGWLPKLAVVGACALLIALCWCCGSLGSAAGWAAIHAEDDSARAERRERRRNAPAIRQHAGGSRR